MAVIKAIMHNLQDSPKIDIFEEYLAGRNEKMEARQQVKLQYYLKQLYGDDGLEVMEKVVQDKEEISTDDFEPIQEAMFEFIKKYYTDQGNKPIEDYYPKDWTPS